MRHINKIALKTTLLAVSGLGLFAASTPALAGGCGYGSAAAHCNMGVNVNMGQAPSFDPMSVNVQQPMGYLRSINYQRAPHTSITRVHGMMDSAALSDFPSNFTDGCHPTSTTYCRQDAGTPVNVEFNAPQAPAYQPAPTFNLAPAPVYVAPPAPRIVAIGGGYDPSKFIPRTYGKNILTPGIAYVPTSFVNRNPADAARVLAENGHSTGSYGAMNYGQSFGSMNLSAALPTSVPVMSAPVIPSMVSGPAMPSGPTLAGGLAPQGNYLGSVVTGMTTTGSSAPSGNAISGVDSTGGYWEKVSGLTMFGDTVATSVVCRRQAPQQQAQIVSPVYGIPQAVPTPRPYFVDVPYKVRGAIPNGCRPAGPTLGPRPMMAPQMPPMPMRPMPVPHVRPAPQLMPGVLPYGPSMGGAAPTLGQMGVNHAGNPIMGGHMRSGWTY